MPPVPDASRRDFIHVMAGTMAVGGAAAIAWPMIAQMEPASDTIAAAGPVTVDLTKVAAGQQITVLWASKPVFVVNRTPAALAELTKQSVLDMLRDPGSDHRQQPPYAKNWSRSVQPEYLVLVGICTHLGCIPGYTPTVGALGPDWPGGWLCPCHGSKYDLAGRVFKSVPAPLNLPVPPYQLTGNKLVIGQNPPGSDFTISDVEVL
jgi:ubiquinol-cytochrome c reductase iron-sulfur subunit